MKVNFSYYHFELPPPPPTHTHLTHIHAHNTLFLLFFFPHSRAQFVIQNYRVKQYCLTPKNGTVTTQPLTVMLCPNPMVLENPAGPYIVSVIIRSACQCPNG